MLEEEARRARQELVRGRVEIGHRRLALVERALLLGAMLISLALALLGGLNLTLA